MAENSASGRLILLSGIAFLLTIYLFRKHKNPIYVAGGGMLTVLLLSLVFIQPSLSKVSAPDNKLSTTSLVNVVKDTFPTNDFKPADSDFEPVGAIKDNSSVKHTNDTIKASGSNERIDCNTNQSVLNANFSAQTGEFSDQNLTDIKSTVPDLNLDKSGVGEIDYKLLVELGGLFSLLILISFFINYQNFRKTRGLFLLGAVAYLGFYKGACPCMIVSLQNTLLAIFGQSISWVSMVWFLGLLPLTYLFGKIWCGWLCHLGGLQEFLFQSPTLGILKTDKAQSWLRKIRVGFLVILIIQLLITKSTLYCHYDPFKVAFNLFSTNITGYVLLAILLISSVLVYRPFCRAVCPVGLILGWISMIPGARRIEKSDSCNNCVSCSKSCKTKALIYENKKSILNVQDCILCGECLDSCKYKSLQIKR